MSSPTAKLHLIGGKGPDLLLIHGFGADRLSWLANVPGLQNSARIWAVDLPGHGAGSDHVGSGDALVLAVAVAAALDAQAGPFTVVGHSLGGAVALHLAALAQTQVARLVLLTPVGLGSKIDGEFLDDFSDMDDAVQARALLERLVERKRLIAPAMAQHVMASLTPARRQALRQIAAGLKGNASIPYPPVQPVQLVWGLADMINPLPAGAETRHGDILTVIPEVGHLPHVEAANKVNEVICAALIA